MVASLRKFLLTFDVEDFINPNAVSILQRILELLDKYELRAIFFITGHMAEKISNYPEIIEQLKNHKIGYHSSSHSVHPIIPEYTDVKSYRKAYEISLERETSHINPLTGEIEGEGGIYFLQDLFHPKKIEAFRAPGMCWTPPHLEALHSLGIKYDFSSNLSFSEPVFWRRITFYPFTFSQEWKGTFYDYECLFHSILKNRVTILDIHPTLFVNRVMWDSIYYRGNPRFLSRSPVRSLKESSSLLKRFEALMKRIRVFQKIKLIDAAPKLESASKRLIIDAEGIRRCYSSSISWAKKYFNYHPRFILHHFREFFGETGK